MDEPSPDMEQLTSDVESIKKDVEQILPALVDALKRNKYFEEMESQLRRAEQVADVWRQWPLVTGVHDVVLAMRTDGSDNQLMVEQLCDVLYRSAGVEEFGLVGEQVDPSDVEITQVEGEGPRLYVLESQRPGLKVGHAVIRKAIVSVQRREGRA